jgi:Xaa-Pro aminopeptidase
MARGERFMQDETEVRVKSRISTPELERRWKAVRQVMKEKSLDFLIMQSFSDVLGGYVKWFTDINAMHSYPVIVIFPREGEMTSIWHGARLPAKPSPPEWAVRGMKKRINVPTLPSLDYSNVFMAEEVVKELAPFKNARIGLLGMGFMSAALYAHITKNLTSATFIEVTDLIDNIKAIKSEEEIKYIKESCAIQDAAFDHVLKIIQPGKTEHDIYTDIVKTCVSMGAEGINVRTGSAQPGKSVMTWSPYFQNKVIEDGDQFTVLIESNGPSGFWGEIMRVICLGKVTDELQKQQEVCVQAQKLALSLLKPGANPGDLFKANNAFIMGKGYAEERRIYAHGMGYDMVERPALNTEEPMKIQAGMNIAVHPFVISDRAAAHTCSNFIVSAKGEPVCLHRTPEKIFTLQ